MLRIHGIPRSRAFRCIWAAEEAGLPYESVAVPFGPELQSAGFLAINPNARIPALEDGPLVLFESLAINLHIAGLAGAPLMPDGDDRSRALQWTLWAATEIEPNILQWANNTFQRPPEQRDLALADAGAAAVHQRFAVLEAHLTTRPFLLGPVFSIADCNLAGVLYGSWFNGFDFSATPRVKAWLDACLNRPAALAARALREA